MNFVLIEVIEREISSPAFFDTYQEAYDEMVTRVRQAFGDDIAFGEEDDVGAVVRKMSAYGEKHGQNFDWQIFEI